jgi:signal transduction protein with GAF and PtsI domain
LENFDKKVDELINQYNELDKEYIEYLEADMNKEARRVNSKMQKISSEINKLREQQEYGLKSEMKRRIDLYRKFINKKGLTQEFENFEEEEEEECL